RMATLELRGDPGEHRRTSKPYRVARRGHRALKDRRCGRTCSGAIIEYAQLSEPLFDVAQQPAHVIGQDRDGESVAISASQRIDDPFALGWRELACQSRWLGARERRIDRLTDQLAA